MKTEAEKLIRALSILLAAREGLTVTPDQIVASHAFMLAWLQTFNVHRS